MTLTPLNRRAVRRGFDRAAPGYDRHAVLQQEVESRLLERLEFTRADPARILDLGCGTGRASAALAERFPAAETIALDWAPGMLRVARERSPASPVCADLLALPLAARSVDLVFSSLTLQWVADWPRALKELRRVLRPDGLLLFSTFGPDTLAELRAAWRAVDDGVHVNEFMDMHIVGDMLVQAGFNQPVVDAEHLVVEYGAPIDLMRELQAIGAHNAARERARGLTGSATLRAVLAAYEASRRGDRYPATYEVVYGTAFGPGEGQPLRGPEGDVATFSLDALRRGRGS